MQVARKFHAAVRRDRLRPVPSPATSASETSVSPRSSGPSRALDEGFLPVAVGFAERRAGLCENDGTRDVRGSSPATAERSCRRSNARQGSGFVAPTCCRKSCKGVGEGGDADGSQAAPNHHSPACPTQWRGSDSCKRQLSRATPAPRRRFRAGTPAAAKRDRRRPHSRNGRPWFSWARDQARRTLLSVGTCQC